MKKLVVIKSPEQARDDDLVIRTAHSLGHFFHNAALTHVVLFGGLNSFDSYNLTNLEVEI